MRTKILIITLIASSVFFSNISIAELGKMDKAEAQARTKFDHIGLAEMYEKEASEMTAKAKAQKELLEEYQRHSEYYGRDGQDFQSHHEALLREYTKAAERNTEMAASHRKMAK
ncbi:hypothetical protein [Nitrosomonas oligotropha]|uniref:hypothetical protein n=1 Tax=Nitrosomonas oligotropha TaxID=42354 RepID=UPI001371038F|nr:hypothetical protein [Nitrosomonas oligotropha]MXS83010.1 hypothetical protein [Nitrosomonas oligotropha]